MREFEIIRERVGRKTRLLVCKRAEDDPDVWDRVNEFPSTSAGLRDAHAYVVECHRVETAFYRER